MAPASAAVLSKAGYSGEEVSAFARALGRVRAGQDEDAAAEAEGVDTGDFYELLNDEDAASVGSRPR